MSATALASELRPRMVALKFVTVTPASGCKDWSEYATLPLVNAITPTWIGGNGSFRADGGVLVLRMAAASAKTLVMAAGINTSILGCSNVMESIDSETGLAFA